MSEIQVLIPNAMVHTCTMWDHVCKRVKLASGEIHLTGNGWQLMMVPPADIDVAHATFKSNLTATLLSVDCPDTYMYVEGMMDNLAARHNADKPNSESKLTVIGAKAVISCLFIVDNDNKQAFYEIMMTLPTLWTDHLEQLIDDAWVCEDITHITDLNRHLN